MDPLWRATDDAIVEALSCVGLWSGVLADREGGLDADITPSSLSKGQQQLLALARALLDVKQGRKVLLLDEPTGSIDRETDAVVRKVLSENCSNCTVITIAHSMDTILASDVVAVMESGMVVEFGEPQELLARNGKFTELVNGWTGKDPDTEVDS